MERTMAHNLVKIFAVLAIVVGVLTGIAAITLFIAGRPSALTGIVGPATDAGAAGLFAAGTAAVIFAVFLLALSIFYLAIGFGLWNMRPWARRAALVLSIISLLNFPIGTILGLVGIWLFGFNDDVKAMFRSGDHLSARTSAAPARRWR